MNIEIRRINPVQDSTLIAWCEKQVFAESDRFSPEAWLGYECFGMYIGEWFMGIAALREEKFFIAERLSASSGLFLGSIGILPDFQNRGFGSILMAWVIACAKNKEAPALRSVVRKDNRGSLRLHQKFGFQIIRQVESYYGNPPSAAFVLELVLKPAPPA